MKKCLSVFWTHGHTAHHHPSDRWGGMASLDQVAISNDSSQILLNKTELEKITRSRSNGKVRVHQARFPVPQPLTNVLITSYNKYIGQPL